ncbi:hypothetical protein [Anaerorhabdus sp.]|uniref:hypothetical protein n=1 Tax=Anaerorhabdus sp. TaxID=1872524 RepID=UPI002FCA62F3
MRSIKKIVLICFVVLFCEGCSSNSYERDTSKGSINFITLEQMVKKIENKETFPIMFTQSMCGYCRDFETVLNPYIKSHHVIIYDVVLDKEETTPAENLKIIKKYFQRFEFTPGIFFVKDGENANQLKPSGNHITEDDLDTWVVKNKIDGKK